MKLLLALLVLAPAVLLVVQSVRGRVQVTSCCSVPADNDARLRSSDAEGQRRDEAPGAQSVPSEPAAH